MGVWSAVEEEKELPGWMERCKKIEQVLFLIYDLHPAALGKPHHIGKLLHLKYRIGHFDSRSRKRQRRSVILRDLNQLADAGEAIIGAHAADLQPTVIASLLILTGERRRLLHRRGWVRCIDQIQILVDRE